MKCGLKEMRWNMNSKVDNVTYGTWSKLDPNLLSLFKQNKALQILEDNTIFTGGHFETPLLGRNKKPLQPYKWNLSIKRFQSSERKFGKNQELANFYKKTTLQKKWRFQLRMSLVNVTTELVTFTEEILNGKLHFFVQYKWVITVSKYMT